MDIKNRDYENCPDEKCWLCHHWKSMIGDPKTLVDENYGCYSDGGCKPNETKYLGHAGRVFIIEKLDGKRIVTNNLWCAGTVPEYFRTPERLPINCTIKMGERKDMFEK